MDEVKEFLVEIVKFNKTGISEEFGDIMHFIQLWLFWKFGINGEIWEISQSSVNKFMARKKVWQKIYKEVGLSKNSSNFCGNYKKEEKVVQQLSKFGVSKATAQKAFVRVVSPLLEDFKQN